MSVGFARPMLSPIWTTRFVAETTASSSRGEDAGESSSAHEAAIKKSVAAHVAAINKRDAKALAALWSPEAVYTDRISGEQVSGIDAITQQFGSLFKAKPDVKLDVVTESVQFVSPNVAVEHGAAKFIAPAANLKRLRTPRSTLGETASGCSIDCKPPNSSPLPSRAASRLSSPACCARCCGRGRLRAGRARSRVSAAAAQLASTRPTARGLRATLAARCRHPSPKTDGTNLLTRS